MTVLYIFYNTFLRPVFPFSDLPLFSTDMTHISLVKIGIATR